MSDNLPPGLPYDRRRPTPPPFLGELVKPPFLLSVLVLVLGGLWWSGEQKARVDTLTGQVAELRTLVAEAVRENVEQRVSLARLMDAATADRARIDQQIDRVVRVQERQSQDISRLLLLAPGQQLRPQDGEGPDWREWLREAVL